MGSMLWFHMLKRHKKKNLDFSLNKNQSASSYRHYSTCDLEINFICLLLHSRVQICSLIFFIRSSKSDSNVLLLDYNAYHSDLLLLHS